MTNYYSVLGISKNASVEEIKVAFKKQAVKYHPDKHPDNPQMEEKFKEVNQAHQILSDQYEKARYDLKLAYQKFADIPSNPPAYSYKKRSVYTPPQIDYRQNAIATFYAFAITCSIAVVVMIGFWIKKGYDQMRLEELLAERREVYKQARVSFDNEDYESSFTLMSSLNLFRVEEHDMKLFKKNMINSIISEGDHNFENDEFDEAIYLYELVQQFESEKSLFLLKTQLAKAYKRVNNPIKSIAIYEDLMMREYKVIASLVEIAEIQRDLLNDMASAKDYYMTAHQLAIKQYKSLYGEAYSLVINEQYVPAEHYYLYTGLSNIYLRLNDPEMAIKAADWNKYVWPDSTQAYVTSAHAYLAKDMQRKACIEFGEALKRGWSGIPTVICN